MYSGGEVTAPKTVVGAVKDNAILKSDSNIKPEREPGNDVGAVRDTAGIKYYFDVEPKEQATPEDGVRTNGCGEISSEPCYFINEDPLVQVYQHKMKPLVVRLPGLVAIPEEKPAEEELYLPPLVAIPKEEREEEAYLPPLIDLSGNEVVDPDIVMLPLVAVVKSQKAYLSELLR